MQLTEDDIAAICDEDYIIDSNTSRQGTTTTYAFKKDGKFWAVSIQNDGVQPPEVTEIVEINPSERTTIEWHRASNGSVIGNFDGEEIPTELHCYGYR